MASQITVGLLQEQGQKLITARECLAPGYLRLTQADIAFMASGEVMVAASDGMVGSAVQCFNVSVKVESNSCHIFSAPGASFFLKSLTDYNNRDNQNVSFIIIIIYPLTARVVGAPQMILQPVSYIFSLVSTALRDLAHSRPVHFLMSSHLILCLPCLLPPFTLSLIHI